MIRPSPYPPGKTFAITFVDDTDQSTLANTEPVYDLLAEHGFWGTKTVWPLRAKRSSVFRRSLEAHAPPPDSGSTLQDADYAAFVNKLQACGFEIALHGVAAGNSTRQEIETGLQYFRDIVGAMPALNAFHQTNIENLYCGIHKLDAPVLRFVERMTDHSDYEGHREGTPAFWGDLVQQTFRYVRLPFHTIDEVDTLRVNPSMPFTDARRPYVRRWFASSDGGDVLRFNRLLSSLNVERLERRRGVCVIYTHFAKLFARRGPNGYRLDSTFSDTVRRVTGNPRAWFAKASDVLDRLAVTRQMYVRHEANQLQIQNNADVAIDNVVLMVPPGMEIANSGGVTLNVAPDTAVLPRLVPNQMLTLRTSKPGSQTILPQATEIPRRERRRIEYWNYRGLVRGLVRDRAFYERRRWLKR